MRTQGNQQADSPGPAEGRPEAPVRAPRLPGILLRALSLAGFVGLLLWLQHRFHLLDYFSAGQIDSTLAAIRGRIDGFGILGPAVFVAASAAAVVANIPTGAIVCVSVLLFGPLLGCLLGFAIAAAGISLVHLIAQKVGRPIVLRLMGQRLAAAESQFAERGLRSVILLRLVFFMAPVLNWTLGLSPLRYRTLVLGSVVGAAPGIIVISWLSHAVLDALRAGQSLNPLRFPQLWIPLGLALALLGGLPLFDRIRRRRLSRANPNDCRPSKQHDLHG